MIDEPKIDRALDYQWIWDHAEEYRGRWVAVHKGELVADCTTLEELLDHVDPLPLSPPPLLHKFPE